MFAVDSFNVPTYPVAMTRLSRTKTAPTRRFMQLDLREARDASVCDFVRRSAYDESFVANHKIGIPTRP